MAVLDTLQILVEADSRGLSTTLKKASDTISQFVSSSNSQQLDWENILGGALNTSIISGIASSFALAIEQAVSFQNTMLDVSNNTQGATGATASALSNSVLTAAQSTGASLSDTAAAYQAFYKQFGDAAAAQQLTAEAGQLALASNQSLVDLMPQLISLFNNWGINTLPAAQAALTGLVNQASTGKFTLNELLDVIGSQGTSLQGVTNITAMATQMQALSNNATLSKGTIVSTFDAISNGVANPIASIDLLNGGVNSMATNLKKSDGLIAAFAVLSKTISGAGIAGNTLATNMGLASDAGKQLGSTSSDAYNKTATAADAATAHQQSFQDVINKNLSASDKFKISWDALLADLTKDVGFPALTALQGILTPIFNTVDGLLKDVGTKDLGTTVADFVNNAVGNPLKNIGQSIANAIDPNHSIGNAVAGVLPGLKPPALNNGPASNSTSSNNPTAVTLNITNNIGGSGNAPAGHQILGQSLGDKAYQAFVGLLASI